MKGLAITQIIMLVLGIIVLAVIGFLLYSNFLSSAGQLDVNKCLALATNSCRAAKVANDPNWPNVKMNLPKGCGVLTNQNGQNDVPCNFDSAMRCYDWDGTSTKIATTASDCSRVVGSAT